MHQASVSARGGLKRPSRRRKRAFPLLVYVLVLPPVLYRLVWSAWPLLQTAYLSLTNSNFIYGTSKFIGLDNYVEMAQDEGFWYSMATTLIYAMVLVVGTIGLGLLIARMLLPALPGQSLGRVAILIPYIIPSVLAAHIWRTMAANSGSPLNSVLSTIGIIDNDIAWLANAWSARVIVIAASLWRSVPFAALLFLAALSSVPQEVHEASAIDGAGPWRQFWSIDLPIIKATILVVTTFQAIEALRTFDIVYGLTKGGPGRATELISYTAYQDMFFYGQSGYGSAEAMALIVLSAIVAGLLSIALVRTQRSA